MVFMVSQWKTQGLNQLSPKLVVRGGERKQGWMRCRNGKRGRRGYELPERGGQQWDSQQHDSSDDFSTITCHLAAKSPLSNFLSGRAEEYQGPDNALNEATVIKHLGMTPSAVPRKTSWSILKLCCRNRQALPLVRKGGVNMSILQRIATHPNRNTTSRAVPG